MKRLMSTILAVLMLLGMFSVTAFAAEGFVITADPEDTSAEFGAPVTLKVEAEGEGLSYQWYAWPENGIWPLNDDQHGVEGANTPSLTVPHADCRMNDIPFYCTVSNGEESETSATASVTVPHSGGLDYYYSETEHLVVCATCKGQISMEPHQEDCVCGYTEGAPEKEPMFIEDAEDRHFAVENGEDVQIHHAVIGLDLTYKWSRYDSATGEYVSLANGEEYDGVNTDTLTIYGVHCAEGEVLYSCEARNTMGLVEMNYTVTAYHSFDRYVSDGHGHTVQCVCGVDGWDDYHIDDDQDGNCDECAYVFHEKAPKITVQPADAFPKNGHAPLTYKVEATGEGLTYRWYSNEYGELEDDAHYQGTATDTLTVSSRFDPDEGEFDCFYPDEYRCIVSNEYGTVISDYGEYEPEHYMIAYAEAIDEYTHDEICLCGDEIGENVHSDSNNDGLCDVCEGEYEHPFLDVTDFDAWYYKAAVYAKVGGIFMGSYGKLNPDDNITRGEVAAVLARLAVSQDVIDMMDDTEFETLLEYISEENGTTPVEFTDIEGKFYERHARVAAAFGLINGYEGGRFGGEQYITREELATVLMRIVYFIVERIPMIEGVELAPPVDCFNDAAKVSDWAKPYVEDARAIGLFCGDQNGNFCPQDNATRAETAQTLLRMELPAGLLFLLLYAGSVM